MHGDKQTFTLPRLFIVFFLFVLHLGQYGERVFRVGGVRGIGVGQFVEFRFADDTEAFQHVGVAVPDVGMDALERQRQHDAFVEVLSQVERVVGGRDPQNVAVAVVGFAMGVARVAFAFGDVFADLHHGGPFEVYRAAEREINKRLNTLAARYPNQGNEMYLCMTALDIALSLKRNEQNNDTQPFVESMQRMLQGVEEALATTSR